MASRVPRRPPAGRCATLGVGGSRPRWSLAGEPLRRPPLTSSELAMVSHRGERLRTGFNSLLKCSGRRIRPPRLGRGWPWQRLICASEGSPSDPRPTTTRASPKPMAATEPLAVVVARIPHRLARKEVVQRTLGPRQVASWPLATTAGARHLTSAPTASLVATPSVTRFSIYAYQSRGGVKSTRSVARGSLRRRPNVRSRAQTLLCSSGAARWPRC